jgi:hypothetical protein
MGAVSRLVSRSSFSNSLKKERKFVMTAAAIWLGASALIAVARPWLVLRGNGCGAARPVPVRLAWCSGLLVMLVLAASSGLTFSSQLANVIAVMTGLAGAGVLSLHAFGLQPRWFGIAVGLSCILGWLLGLVFWMMMLFFDGLSPVTVQLDDGVHCRASLYGFVGSSGQSLELFRHYALIDYKLVSVHQPDFMPDEALEMPNAFRRQISACMAAIARSQIITAAPASS